MDRKVEAPTTQLSTIDQSILTPLVLSALNSKTAEVIGWNYGHLHGGAGTGNAIYRFRGQGRDQEQEISWSLILKTVRPERDSTHISAWNYYKREADAYRSGWLAELPGQSQPCPASLPAWLARDSRPGSTGTGSSLPCK